MTILPCNGATHQARERTIEAPAAEAPKRVRNVPWLDQGFTGATRIMAGMEMFRSLAMAAASSATPPPWELPISTAERICIACMKARGYPASEVASPASAGWRLENPVPGRSGPKRRPRLASDSRLKRQENEYPIRP